MPALIRRKWVGGSRDRQRQFRRGHRGGLNSLAHRNATFDYTRTLRDCKAEPVGREQWAAFACDPTALVHRYAHPSRPHCTSSSSRKAAGGPASGSMPHTAASRIAAPLVQPSASHSSMEVGAGSGLGARASRPPPPLPGGRRRQHRSGRASATTCGSTSLRL